MDAYGCGASVCCGAPDGCPPVYDEPRECARCDAGVEMVQVDPACLEEFRNVRLCSASSVDRSHDDVRPSHSSSDT